ncbi:HNH endonuclease [Arthrobacter sp. H-02-3]|uniref:HNH endonuclease n=1 Tax=Arthrobacter sp. H-02-3 TaxID=2703675 RepID=UPI000DD1B141|nr:HNH endonuclease signature motif containing protein [Arthrobacter sp. H-02-3]PVZ53697.1 HNH endonuclease [Arthrobacter sp. H-02-3]
MVELKRIYWNRQALKMAYSAVVVWLGASVVLALMPKADAAARHNASTVAEILRSMVDGVLAAVIVPGLFLVVLTVVAAVIRARDLKRRDPVRRFSRQQRREGLARAGGQCEMESGLRRRCPRPAEHGDHFYPWSKGGSTSMQNFVAACARCNRTKGARVPSPGQQERLERRRRTYVTLEDAVAVGERQPLG